MTLRIGVIGTGAIGQEHIARLHGKLSGSEVVAVNDINADGARAAAERLCPGAAVHATGQGVIDDPNVDAVVVASWGPAHAESVLGSIAAGKPVFCEKPLATTAADCFKIVEAEIASGRHLVQVGFMRRYDAGYRLLKKTVAAGEIGEPLLLHCAHRNPDVPDNYLGDMGLTDTFVHEIDVLRWLVNDDYVSAQVIDAKPTRHARGGLQDPCMVILRTKSGIVIDTEIFVNCQFGYDIQCQVVGEDGTANLPEPATVPMRKASVAGRAIMMDWKLRFIDSYDVELQEWIESTKAGRVDGPTAWDGYFASVTADACVEARRTGQIVPITVKDKPSFYA